MRASPMDCVPMMDHGLCPRQSASHQLFTFQAIRSGLSNASAGPDEAPFALRAHRMGLRAGIDSARLNRVSDELEAAGFEELSRRLAKAHGKSPSRKRLTDAQIAAMALSHRAVVHTADRDFLRFPQVRCHFPLDE